MLLWFSGNLSSVCNFLLLQCYVGIVLFLDKSTDDDDDDVLNLY